MDTCLKLDSFAFVADSELILALEKRSTPVVCDEDRVLFTQGDAPRGLYLLRKGDALLTMHAATGEVVMCVEVLAGSLLGLPGLIGNVSYSLTATARKGSELDFIAREDFLGLMQTEPSLSLKVLHILAAEVRAARRALL